MRQLPSAPWPRALWSFAGVAGTLFLAVVIARLVGVAGFADRDQRAGTARDEA